MKLADLSEATRQKISKVRWDSIVEKHEEPFDWDCILDDDSEPDFFVEGTDLSRFARKIEDVPEFLIVDDRPILLPIPRKYHPNIEISRTVWSADGNSVTIFLTDTSFSTDWFEIGYLVYQSGRHEFQRQDQPLGEFPRLVYFPGNGR